MSQNMKDIVENFVTDTCKLLVDTPDEVVVDIIATTKAILGQIRVAKGDYGKVIGKKGRTISSLKVITNAVKNANFPDDNRKVLLEIVEDEVFRPRTNNN